MKKYIVVMLLLTTVGFAQRQFNPVKAQLVKTYTTFTATSDDTSGVVSIPVSDNLVYADEVYLTAVATDSAAFDAYFIGTNPSLSSIGTTYADSLVGTSNSSNVTTITLKSSTVNRLPGCTQFKIGTVFRASGQGTTAGRTVKWYITWFPKSN